MFVMFCFHMFRLTYLTFLRLELFAFLHDEGKSIKGLQKYDIDQVLITRDIFMFHNVKQLNVLVLFSFIVLITYS